MAMPWENPRSETLLCCALIPSNQASTWVQDAMTWEKSLVRK
ncbi:hypothetical protein QFZ52_000097 [Arthrobacter woluwensis]|nr:hypothetical protein [Arthrobacter woluwensis]